MDGILSQDEINALLKGMNVDGASDSAAPADSAPEGGEGNDDESQLKAA